MSVPAPNVNESGSFIWEELGARSSVDCANKYASLMLFKVEPS